jgi:hypothetical protein
MKWLFEALGLVLPLLATAHAQVIEFEANGLKYQTLTKSGVTIMFALLPAQVRNFSIVQVAVSNGSGAPYIIRPEDFTYFRNDGAVVPATPARNVIALLYQKSSGNDVIRLVTTYEASVYGNPNMVRSTNGYEERRRAALLMSGAKVRAAATASALALVQTKLAPGESTDGAVFFATEGKPLGPGRLRVQTNTDTFEFKPGT